MRAYREVGIGCNKSRSRAIFELNPFFLCFVSIAYEFMIPATMPSSQDNPFEKVSYEITLFVRGRPAKSFFSMSFTHNPTRSVAVEVQ
jgi:hypothetical protein